MAVGFVANRGDNNPEGVGANGTVTLNGQVTAGNLLVLWTSYDSSTPTAPAVGSVSKPGGETAAWAKLAEHVGATSGSMGTACRGELWAIVPAQNWPSGTVVTVAMSGSAPPSRTFLLQEFSGCTATVQASATSTSTSGAPATSSVVVPLGSLMLGGGGCESSSAMTGDADTAGGAWSTAYTTATAGGSSTSNISSILQWKIPGITPFSRGYAPSGSADSGAVVVVLQPAAAGTPLTVADGAHAHTADGLTLTQAHSVAVADGPHAHAADSLTLTQVHGLAVADGVHGHAADAPTLVLATGLTVADGGHGHTADGVTLVQTHNLAAADGIHGHTADALALSQTHVLAVGDAAHGHVADQPALGGAVNLAVADSAHGHAADSPALGQAHNLAVADTTHQAGSDTVSFTGGSTLTPADGLHGHTADSPALTQAHSLAPADAAHGHTADAPVFTQVHALLVADTAHPHTGDGVSVDQAHLLAAADTAHGHTAGVLVLSFPVSDPNATQIVWVERPAAGAHWDGAGVVWQESGGGVFQESRMPVHAEAL